VRRGAGAEGRALRVVCTDRRPPCEAERSGPQAMAPGGP